MLSPARPRRPGVPAVRRVAGVALAVLGVAVVAWSAVGAPGPVPTPVLWMGGAGLVAIGPALAVTGRASRGSGTRRAADRARARVPVEPALTEAELRTRIPVLADVARAQGTSLALVLVGSAAPGATAGVRDRFLGTLTAMSRGDDLRAGLGDAAGVLLPSVSCDEACGYAARVASALSRAADGPVDACVGVALTGVDAYPAAALLRRARRALDAARASGPGAIVLSDSAGTRAVDRRGLAARPTVGRRARR